MARHPYEEPSGGSDNKPRYTGVSDLDDLLQDTVSAASGIGAGVLAGLSEVLGQVGDAIHAARHTDDALPFAQWKRRLDRRLQNGRQSSALAVAITGWVLAGCFGIAAIVMWALAAVGPEALGVTREEFLVFPILMACFTPMTVGFGIMGGIGVRRYRYFNRLRRYLRVARDWVCDTNGLARDSAVQKSQVQKDLLQAVAGGDLPNARLQEDGTLYLDLNHIAPPAQAPEEPAPAAEPVDDLAKFAREGTTFLDYLRGSQGRLGSDADAELTRMQNICAAILAFVRSHPGQLPRVQRFRSYYLPTTRKLLDTAQGLGSAQVPHAREIRRDITGILHTLNQAYEKLYDTLLQEVSLDVSTEIDTLEAMLRQDGLTHDFEMDFKNG